MANDNGKAREYWKRNVRLISILLTIWFLVSYVFGIFLAVPLKGIHIGALDAGFWFAQQGSIYVFVILIFVYAWKMEKLDREYDVHEEDN